MSNSQNSGSPIATYLETTGRGSKPVLLKPGDSFFVQGDPALFVFYLKSGRAKLTVISKRGKEATIMLYKAGDFIGEEAIASGAELRIATATALTACVTLKVDRAAMTRILHENTEFSEMFLRLVLLRGIRTQEDLVDQLFNSSEKRLARLLLLMAEFGRPGEPEMLIPPITQEALAEMVGTTRSRVSYFMNRFRDLGYIEYHGRILVNKSLLNVLLHDQLPEQTSSRPLIIAPPHTSSERTRTQSVMIKLKDPSRQDTL